MASSNSLSDFIYCELLASILLLNALNDVSQVIIEEFRILIIFFDIFILSLGNLLTQCTSLSGPVIRTRKFYLFLFVFSYLSLDLKRHLDV